MKRITVLLLVLLIVSGLVSCNEPKEESSEIQSAQFDTQTESSIPSESSQALTLEQMFEGYIIEEISLDRYAVSPKGYSEYDRTHYITDGKGNIINSFECASIRKLVDKHKFYYVQNSDQSAYFINTNGNRIDDIVYDRLFHWEDVPFQYRNATIFGQVGDEYYLIDDNAKIVGSISTSPFLYEKYDGMFIAKAFYYDDYYYGVMKDGKYVVEPRFWEKPIIKNGRIIANNNAVDTLGSEGYIYDYSGKLVKKVNGHFAAHNDFDYIIQCELKDAHSEDVVFSILSYSGETLYTAEEGVTIGIARSDTWLAPVMPYRVMLNGKTVHLETLIDGIEYPPVISSESRDANGISPEKLSVIQTPYLCGNGGRQYEVTEELKELTRTNLLEYFAAADIEFNEETFCYIYDEGDFFAWQRPPDSFNGVESHPEYISKTALGDLGNNRLIDPLSDPIVQGFCKVTFSALENLKVEQTEEGYIIFERKDSVAETAYSAARKRVEIHIGDDYGSIYATDIGDENIYPAYTLNAISYKEAVAEFRKGNFKTPPYSLLEFDYETVNIEATELVYALITDCSCKECRGNIGYYIPCYSFLIRDKHSPEYVGNMLVPAISIDELNEHLTTMSQPTVNHFWTEE